MSARSRQRGHLDVEEVLSSKTYPQDAQRNFLGSVMNLHLSFSGDVDTA